MRRLDGFGLSGTRLWTSGWKLVAVGGLGGACEPLRENGFKGGASLGAALPAFLAVLEAGESSDFFLPNMGLSSLSGRRKRRFRLATPFLEQVQHGGGGDNGGQQVDNW